MILGQKDPRWANIHLGTSNYYIWAKGCTITEIAECIGTTPDVVNEKLNSVDGFAIDGNGQKSWVIWAKIMEAFPGIKINRVWSYNNDDVLNELGIGNRVIVEVPADPIGNPGGKHWVRYIGDQKLHDPWEAKERSTSDFPNPSGYCVISGDWKSTATAVDASDAPGADLATPNEYKGLDLSNTESVKAAIDAWKDVVDGVYVRKDVICQALEVDTTYSQEAIVEAIKTLKSDFKSQVQVATGLPVAEQIEGEGPEVKPAQPVLTIADVAQHEKEALISLLHNLEKEVKSLLGL